MRHMKTSSQVRPHGDRNVVPEDAQPDGSTHGECPIDPSNLAHMRADRSAVEE
jgi:hypothetical protein